MRKLAVNSIVFLIVVHLTTPAFGFGNTGHKTVGQIAQLRLADTNTLARIKLILRSGETLSNISTWADTVKDEKKFKPQATNSDSDTENFYRNLINKTNRTWHFVNLPLGCTGYQDQKCRKFTSKTDIVQVINFCIRRLRGDTLPPGVAKLTKRNALRMLVHLVGDLHQPLHVGAGYINVNGQDGKIEFARDPIAILENDYFSDLGGNALLIKNEDSDNLHSFWDTDLVETAMGDQSIFQFSTSLNTPAPADWESTGSISTWAAQWAGDSLRVSRTNTYNTIRITKEVVVDDHTKYLVTKAGNYKNQNVPIIEQQLAKGGYRLAKLLEAIFP